MASHESGSGGSGIRLCGFPALDQSVGALSVLGYPAAVRIRQETDAFLLHLRPRCPGAGQQGLPGGEAPETDVVSAWAPALRLGDSAGKSGTGNGRVLFQRF